MKDWIKKRSAFVPTYCSWAAVLLTGVCKLLFRWAIELSDISVAILNVILLIFCIIGFSSLMLSDSSLDEKKLSYIGNFMITPAAYVLNIGILGFRVHNWKDFIYNGWHFTWLLVAVAQILVLSPVGNILRNDTAELANYIKSRFVYLVQWVEKTAKAHPDLVIGLFVWAILIILFREKETSQDFLFFSLIFWGIWLLLCIMLQMSLSISSKLKKTDQKEQDSENKDTTHLNALFAIVVFSICIIYLLWRKSFGPIEAIVIIVLYLGWQLIQILKMMRVKNYLDELEINPFDLEVLIGCIVFSAFFLVFLGMDKEKYSVIEIEDLSQILDFLTSGIDIVKTVLGL